MMSLPIAPTRGKAMLLARGLTLLLAALALLFLPSGRANAYDPWWVQTHEDTQLWSGPDDKAIPFGPVASGTSLLVVAPQQGPRLHVQDVHTGSFAYVDASAVDSSEPPRPTTQVVASPSGPAGIKRTPPKVPAGFTPFWIANYEETDFWTGPESWAYSVGKVPQFRRLLVVEAQKGDRLRVWSPETDSIGYVDTAEVGPVGPSAWLEPHPLKITAQVQMTGRSVGSTTYVRNLPFVADETELRRIPNNTRLTILETGVTSDGQQWYRVGEGMYVPASQVRLPTKPEAYLEGRWIDADLAEPAMVTAYEGDKVVYSALAIIGTEATPTLRGAYRILRRVDNETMDSSTLGIPKDGPGGYYLKDVLYTQYFTPQGAALHYNWWLGTFGLPGSHGCLGLNLEDSEWFWDWDSVGTPIVVR